MCRHVCVYIYVCVYMRHVYTYNCVYIPYLRDNYTNIYIYLKANHMWKHLEIAQPHALSACSVTTEPCNNMEPTTCGHFKTKHKQTKEQHP